MAFFTPCQGGNLQRTSQRPRKPPCRLAYLHPQAQPSLLPYPLEVERASACNCLPGRNREADALKGAQPWRLCQQFHWPWTKKSGLKAILLTLQAWSTSHAVLLDLL